MNGIDEIRLHSAGPAGLADPGRLAAKVGAGTTGPAAVPPAPNQALEPDRPQTAEQRLRRNRAEEGPSPTGAGGPAVDLSFGDFLDLINPLQHIPVVSTIYRTITGDEISGPAKILGGMLFGGPIGFIASAFDTIVAQATGRDMGETVLAAFAGPEESPAPQLAARQDIKVPAEQDGAPEDGAPGDSAPIASHVPAQALNHKDPFGLARGVAAPIVTTPGALAPASLAPAAAPSAPLPAQNARPLATVSPGPDTSPLIAAAPARAPVIGVELISTGAPKPGNQHLIPSIANADRGFAERMLEALDKYEIQASERLRSSGPAAHYLDLDL